MQLRVLVAALLSVTCSAAPSQISQRKSLPALPKALPKAFDRSGGAALAPVASLALRGGGYNDFAKAFPMANGVLISLLKTGLADVLAQSSSSDPHDWTRTAMFGVFGGVYLGLFQYWYQVNIFSKVFSDIPRFTSQTWAEKFKDAPGLKSLACQIAINQCVLAFCYLPLFYIFKATAFTDCNFPVDCFASGFSTYLENFGNDIGPLLMCWIPADFVCFSVPLHHRLPLRHVWSFFWHAGLSYFRGGH